MSSQSLRARLDRLRMLRAGGLSMSEMADIARRVCEEDLNVTSEVQPDPSDPWGRVLLRIREAPPRSAPRCSDPSLADGTTATAP
jgi:hypothetical protein